MAGSIVRGGSKRALIALAFPLAVLVPLAVPFGAGQVTALGLPEPLAHRLTALGSADAATIKRANARKAAVRKVAVRKSVATKRVCTTRRVNGKVLKRCKVVRSIAPPVVTFAPPRQSNPSALMPVQPPLNYGQTAPPPLPVSPPYFAQSPSSSAIAYFWIDQADSYAQAIGNSPPDFSFACGGVDCWAWISRAGEVLIIEPARDGVLQYFFAPRETSPYLARDSYTSFAFDGRELVQVYDNQGRLYTSGLTSQARYDGEALQSRGRALFAASLRQRRWDRGTAAAWRAQYSSYGFNDGWNTGWDGDWRGLPDWDRFERDRRHQHPPRHLDDEHHDRRDARNRYDDWHRRGDHGPPPMTGNPVVTPGGGSAGAVTPPAPHPHPAPLPDVQPQPQPPLASPPLLEADNPPPPPSDAASPPRRPRPDRELDAEPGMPPVPQRRPMPPVDQPVVQIQAGPEPAPVPVPAPIANWPAAPAPAPQSVAPAPEPAPAPPPPPDRPAREQFRAESPNGDSDQP